MRNSSKVVYFMLGVLLGMSSFLVWLVLNCKILEVIK